MSDISTSSPPRPAPVRALLGQVIRGLGYGFLVSLIAALYIFSFPKILTSLLGMMDEGVFGAVHQADYAHACPDETELVVEQIPHWGHFYYCERVESDGNRIKHGLWVYWGKFGVKLRQGQFENGKKIGLWYAWKGVNRKNYRVDEYRDDKLFLIRQYHFGKRVCVFTVHKGRLLELRRA